jgi:hypothetical protein
VVWLLLLGMCAWSAGPGAQTPDGERANQVKAAYLINFLRYTDWPAASFPTPETPFRIVVAGGPGLLDAIRGIAGAAGRVAGRAIEVERMELPPSGVASGSAQRAQIAARLRQCHVLFVERSDPARADELIGLVRDYPVLTVGDVDRFAASGGMLELLPRGPNIVIAANPGAIRRSDLVVSAKVLKLAQLVDNEEQRR